MSGIDNYVPLPPTTFLPSPILSTSSVNTPRARGGLLPGSLLQCGAAAASRIAAATSPERTTTDLAVRSGDRFPPQGCVHVHVTETQSAHMHAHGVKGGQTVKATSCTNHIQTHCNVRVSGYARDRRPEMEKMTRKPHQPLR